MCRIKSSLFILILTLVFSSCIEPFSLNIGNQPLERKYVVYGQITDQEGYQDISISKSSSIDDPKFTPLTNCQVSMNDNLGNVFILSEFEEGNYRAWIDKKYLIPGNSYRINVLTPNGIEIESDFDQMPECPEVDTVYYIREDLPTSNPQKFLQGIQFYIDINGENTNSNYYRLEVVETWEHHAAFPMQYFWNMRAVFKFHPDDIWNNFYCWTTENIGNYFTISTKGLIQNRYNKYKLHFVDNQTQRLTYCYSLLINQYVLSEPAFNYWEKLQINSSNHGGLYDTQPLHVKGNLKSPTNPELEILGFFSASPYRAKRIFVQNVKDLEPNYPYCQTSPIEDLKRFRTFYIVSVGGALEAVEDNCVICDLNGGTTTKPDYWPY